MAGCVLTLMNVRKWPILFSNVSRAASVVDAFGCLRSLRALVALDGVSWVWSGLVETAVGRSVHLYPLNLLIRSRWARRSSDLEIGRSLDYARSGVFDRSQILC